MQEKNHAHLTEVHIQRIFIAFRDYTDIPHFSAVVENGAILANNANMSVHHYVKRQTAGVGSDFQQCLTNWQTSSKALNASMESLLSALS